MIGTSRAEIAETFLGMLASPDVSNAGNYVSNAHRYGVTVDRIVAITGFDRGLVTRWIEEDK